MSHPSWVCGLKLPSLVSKYRPSESHPSWVCGLKLDPLRRILQAPIVTPFVGVWIETVYPGAHLRLAGVTPFVGVWIETDAVMIVNEDVIVTPFVGVWIETCLLLVKSLGWCCHTLRGCVD